MTRRRAQTAAWGRDIPRRFCWRSPDRGDPRCFRVAPGDVARISDPPRLRIQEPVPIPPVIISKFLEITHTGPGIRLPLSRHTAIGELEEGQQWQPRAAPVENLMGKATRRSLMLPPCCSTPMPRVATPARGSFLPRRYNPVSLQGGCLGKAVELQVASRVQP